MKKIRKTCLIVGEGHSEVALLKHLRKMDECRKSNLKITIKNAFGKGARNVIEYTIRSSSHIDYNIIIAFFDTDTDWDPHVEKKAKDHDIITIKSIPCLEGMLLRVLGVSFNEHTDLKRMFSSYINNDSTKEENYSINFSQDKIKNMNGRDKEFDKLLKKMGFKI